MAAKNAKGMKLEIHWKIFDFDFCVSLKRDLFSDFQTLGIFIAWECLHDSKVWKPWRVQFVHCVSISGLLEKFFDLKATNINSKGV